MIYPIRCMLGGFTFCQSMELWKQKLQLFNPRTYEVLMFIKLKWQIFYLKLAADL